MDKIHNIGLLPEETAHDHTIKLLLAKGVGWGLRGNLEHTLLELHNIDRGIFEESHPFAGMTYLGYNGLCDKTHKLSYTTTTCRENYVSLCIDYIVE